MTTLYEYELLDQEKFKKHHNSLRINKDEVLKRHPGCWHVGQFPLRDGMGTFTDWPADVYYNPTPDTSLGHGHYFAVYVRDEQAFVSGPAHIEQLIFRVYEDGDDYIYSRFQHDFRHFGDAPEDGGREFFTDGGAWLPDQEYPESFSMWGRCGGVTVPKGFSAIVRDGMICRLIGK